jgi:hypothetical protein
MQRGKRPRRSLNRRARRRGSIEIKPVTPSVFLSSDAGNPDTYRHFLSSEIASKENKWTGRNVTRWQSPEYDKLAELG